jgi:hypothetical protein
MCELAIFILYTSEESRYNFIIANDCPTIVLSKDQAKKVLYITFYKYIGCMSIRKLPTKIVIYYMHAVK